MKRKLDQHILDSMSKDLGNWRGPFYCNRKDPRLIVPKSEPMLGWTLNFANSYTYLLVFTIVIIIIGSQFLF